MHLLRKYVASAAATILVGAAGVAADTLQIHYRLTGSKFQPTIEGGR